MENRVILKSDLLLLLLLLKLQSYLIINIHACVMNNFFRDFKKFFLHAHVRGTLEKKVTCNF